MIQSILIERVVGGYFARAVGRAAKLTGLRSSAITANYGAGEARTTTPRSSENGPWPAIIVLSNAHVLAEKPPASAGYCAAI